MPETVTDQNMQRLQVALPGEGRTQAYNVSPDMLVSFEFDVTDAVFSRNGNDLVIRVDGEGTIVFEDYILLNEGGQFPVFELAGGELVPGNAYLFAFSDIEDPQEDIETAAEAGGSGSGAGVYSDDSGSLYGGIAGLGPQEVGAAGADGAGDEAAEGGVPGVDAAAAAAETNVTAPSVSGGLTVELDEDGSKVITEADILSVVTDPDPGAELSVTSVSVSGGTLTQISAGAWLFEPDADFNGELDLEFSVSDGAFSVDGGGSVIVNPVNDAPVPEAASTSVQEDGSVSGRLVAEDIDNSQDELSFRLADPDNAPTGLELNQDGTYTVNAAAYDYLPEGQSETFSVEYIVSDGAGGESTQTLQITVNGTNDAADITVEAGDSDTGSVTEDDSTPTLTTSGALTVTDVDAGEEAFDPDSVQGPADAQGSLTIDANGNWEYTIPNADVQSLGEGDSFTETFTVQSADGTATHDVVVTVNGTNDAADITVEAGDSDTGSVTEDDSTPTLTTSGALTVTDVDAGEEAFDPDSVQGPADAQGSLTIDANGNWEYTIPNADVQSLGEGDSFTETFTVQSADGTATHDVVVTVNGTNDAADITVEAGDSDTGSVTEDDSTPTLTTSGALTVTDVDAGEEAFDPDSVQGPADAQGSLTIDANGNWEYTIPNADVQSLGEGDSFTETFTVQSADGTATHDVVVTVNGTNDAPTIDLDAGARRVVDFVSESASHNNIFGVYVVDADGNPGSPQVILNNQNALTDSQQDGVEAEGHTLATLPEGGHYEYFLIANGASSYPDLADSQLSFDTSGEKPQLLVDGNPSSRPVFFSQDEYNPDNLDGSDPGREPAPGHFIIETQADGSTIIRVEDLWNGGDNDYRDVVVRLTTEEGTDGTGFEGTFVEDAGQVYIASGSVSIADVDSDEMTNAEVTLENPQAGDQLRVGNLPEGISAEVVTADDGVGLSVLLTADAGTASAADFEAAIRNISFYNDSESPDTSDRTITVQVSDDNGATSNSAETVIRVVGVNDRPVAVNDSATVDEGQSVEIDVLANDSDVDGGTLSLHGTPQAENGVVEVGEDGKLTYTPNEGFTGTDTITYGVNDGQGGYDSATVNVVVNDVNEAPVSESFGVESTESGPVEVDFLSHTQDTDGEVSEIVITKMPEGGTLYYTDADSGDTVAVQESDVTGDESGTRFGADGTFTFEADGSGESSILLGTKTVGDQALANWGEAVDGNPAVRELTLADGNVVTVSSDSGPLRQYNQEQSNHMGIGIGDADGNGINAGETVTVDFGDEVVSTARIGFDGLGDHFDAQNGQATAVWVAKLDGQEVARGVMTQGEDGDPLFEELLITSDDVEGGLFDSIEFTTDSQSGSNWELRYVEAEFGTDTSIGFVPVDNEGAVGNESFADVELTPDALANEPPAADSFTESATSSEPVDISFGDHVTDAEDDASGAETRIIIKTLPDEEHGYLVDADGNPITEAGGEYDMEGIRYVPLDSGEPAPVSGAFLGAREVGDESLDNWGQAVDASTRVMQIADGVTATLSVGDGALQQYHQENSGHMGIGVGDDSGEGINADDTLTLSFDGAKVSHAEVGLDGLGGHFVPDGNGQTVATATWAAYNGDELVASGNVVNDTEGLQYTLTIGQDELGGALFDRIEFSTDSDQGSNWELRYVDAEFGAGDSFQYAPVDSDGVEGDTATVNLTLDAPDSLTNENPVVNGETYTVEEDGTLSISAAELLGNDHDLDGDTLTIDSVQGAQNGTVELVDGDVVFTPDADFNGDASFSYTVSDGKGGTADGSVQVDVTPVNDAPEAVDDEFGVVSQAETLAVDTGVVTDIQQTVSEWAESGVTVEAKTGDALDPGSWNDATLSTKSVNADQVGGNDYSGLAVSSPGNLDGGEVDLQDGQESTGSELLAVSFASPMQNVTLTLSALFDGNDGAPFDSGHTESARVAAFDADGDLMGYVDVQGTQDGLAEVTLDVDDLGFGLPIASVSVMPLDDGAGAGGTNSDFLLKAVSGETMPEVSGTYYEGETITLDSSLLVTSANAEGLSDSDPDGDSLSVTSVGNASHGSVTLDANGQIQFVPEDGYSGQASFQYTVEDGNGGQDSATVTLNIAGRNEAPSIDLDATGEHLDVTADISNSWGYNLLGTYVVDADGNPTVSDVLYDYADEHGPRGAAKGDLLSHIESGETPNFFIINSGDDRSGPAFRTDAEISFTKDGDGQWWATGVNENGEPMTQRAYFDNPEMNADNHDRFTIELTRPDGSERWAVEEFNGHSVDYDDIRFNVVPVEDDSIDYSTTFNTGDEAVSVAGDVSITDADGSSMAKVVLTLTNAQDGDVLDTSGVPDSLFVDTDTTEDGQIVVTISGKASAEDYESAVQAVKFSTDSQDDTPREITVTLTDSEGRESLSSETATSVINVNTAAEGIVNLDVDGTEVVLTSTAAGYGNMLGVYRVDEDGAPTDPEIILADSRSAAIGDVLKTFAGDEGVRFFLIPDGADQGLDLDGDMYFVASEGRYELAIGNQHVDVKFDDPAFNPESEEPGFRFEEGFGPGMELDDGDSTQVAMDDQFNGPGRHKTEDNHPYDNNGNHDDDDDFDDLVVDVRDTEDGIFHGGDGNDVAYGMEGNDTLHGAGGDDLLVGGNGADILNGGDGNDLLFGGAGNDTVLAGGGEDRVHLGSGEDSIFIDPSVLTNGSEIVVEDYNVHEDSIKLGDGMSVESMSYDPDNELAQMLVSEDNGDQEVVVKLMGMTQADFDQFDSTVHTDVQADDLVQQVIDSANDGQLG